MISRQHALGQVAVAGGDHTTAGRHLTAALRLYEACGGPEDKPVRDLLAQIRANVE